MKPMAAALALGCACVACCALPLVAAAGSAAYVGGATGIAIAAIAGALAWYALRRQPLALHAVGQPTSACGCAPSEVKRDEIIEEAIACTLQADDFRSRTAWIRDIAERHLRKSTRSALTLHLVYAGEATDDIREMVRKERACCPFLRFDLSIADNEVHLLITAPEAAREAAGMLFDHFAPDLAPARAT